jgi:beta-xylosidase
MRRTVAAAILVTTAAVAAVAFPPVSALADGRPSAGATPTTYRNPVSASFADTFADPSLVRGKDGWWYAYATSDPLRQGEHTPHLIPMARSRDLAHWDYVRDALPARPAWADSTRNASLWAPDIRYVDGQYRLYYVVTETTVTPEPNDNAIGMATAPTPTGPWTDSGAPVVPPRRGGAGEPGNFLWTFDPAAVTSADGSQWLFYGSYYGGIWVTRLSDDGRRAVGQPTRVAIDNKFEGAYAVQHGGWWYLFASTANCCAGPTTGYSVQVGRSRAITGPYVDRQGVPLDTSRAGGTPTLMQNGNRWVGTGHNAIATDVRGQDWVVYHAIDPDHPYLDGTDGINRRPMLLDRLDWVDGWPQVRAGRGPSDTTQPGPDSATAAVQPSRGAWTRQTDSQAGQVWTSTAAGTLLAATPRGGGVRVEADLRSTGSRYGLEATLRNGGVAELSIDPTTRVARLVQRSPGRLSTTTARIPAQVDLASWQSALLEVSDRGIVGQLSHARLGDPYVALALTGGLRASARTAGPFAGGPGVAAANPSVARPVTPPALAPDVVPSRLDPRASDEFSTPGLSGWTWRRPDPAAHIVNGQLEWPTQAGDLVGPTNDASVLLRDPGAGAWTAETKVSIDLGVDSVRNFQQAGLVAWAGDDDFARLDHVAIWNTRQVEFGREQPYAGRLSYGGTIVGPPAQTTWLRIVHSIDPGTGEHHLRAWSSRDGSHWVKGGVWTMPPSADLRIGLVSHGGVGATARFDYLRIYR